MQNLHHASELPHVRRQKILLLLERDGKVMASDLGQHFAVSEDTIRRDLAELAQAGLLQRVHGGALPRPKDTGKDYFTRIAETNEVKRYLAQLAVRRIEDGQIVLFDSGSTTLQIAQSLPSGMSITAVTCSPMIAMTLAEHKGVTVILAGGTLNPLTMAVGGHEAVRLIQGIKADLLFTGVCAIHPEVGISCLRYEELAVKQALLDSASHVVAVTTADKLGAVEPFVVAPCSRLQTMITEHQVSDDIETYRRMGIEVVQAQV
ncbi:DeoR/GlpR family DNA-binding transcription regulator [Pseudomonas gingeri]|uniref:DeoR/GlpR transcriptional regulator n=1 Tax=Pseudomonas gingeri TaxID=117681 RepID=A0A7Y8CLI7_9PSED|nr:DeoR/GlpR family DNA-binding transcription regulator [Pseudomonas gingeri]NWA01393.1 DeoR/GlpR transcriptional regulator [Pseudomonas gingeri]NWA13804.1 DeoR/GlpR transcriptional regulator [Pseudomonas gingeri]NWA52836.1 DeoR/GlpR transcriptional regulator [Pseudomonas gingeri]NWA96333.1 DeoR/GlpR transcriptional regulator [Pseudomonas gingeri]NWB00031.1 DeoR/GlpR transcriptional regulator [Pseudomonas gingeri]